MSVRTETKFGTECLVTSITRQVPNIDFPQSWDGRFIVPQGACTADDGGCVNSLGRVFNTRPVGGDRLEFELWFELPALSDNQKAAVEQGSFDVMPMAYGSAGIPSHFEASFADVPAANMIANREGGFSMDKLFVNPQQKKDPEPLVVPCLQEALRQNRNPLEKQIDEAKGPHHIEEDDTAKDVLKKIESTLKAPSLEESLKAKLAKEKASKPQGNAAGQEPSTGLTVQDFGEACRKNRGL